MARQITPVKERFEQYFSRSQGCWLWRGAVSSGGYGAFSLVGRKGAPAHVVAYELVKGSVPAGHTLDHLCRNRLCVNPSHLEAVTQKVNLSRAPSQISTINAAKTHCNSGHILSGENLYTCPQGKRNCRACRRLAGQRYRLTKKVMV